MYVYRLPNSCTSYIHQVVINGYERDDPIPKDTVEIFSIEPLNSHDSHHGRAMVRPEPISKESQLSVHSGAMLAYGKNSGREKSNRFLK